jgi:hypothetical protein
MKIVFTAFGGVLMICGALMFIGASHLQPLKDAIRLQLAFYGCGVVTFGLTFILFAQVIGKK